MKTDAEVYVWYGRQRMSHCSGKGTPEEWYADLVRRMETDTTITRVDLVVWRRVKCRNLCKTAKRTANTAAQRRREQGDGNGS